MKILFFGDSITDMDRNKTNGVREIFTYGAGFPYIVACELLSRYPKQFKIVNRGIGGNRIVDLYARIKRDVWVEEPDVLNILIGINDICHEDVVGSGVELSRWEKVYRAIIEETRERLPNIKIVLCEPFVLHGWATEKQWSELIGIKEYAKTAKKLAEEYGLGFIPLQEKFDETAVKYGAEYCSDDGIHTTIVGAKLIADAWLDYFNKNIML